MYLHKSAANCEKGMWSHCCPVPMVPGRQIGYCLIISALLGLRRGLCSNEGRSTPVSTKWPRRHGKECKWQPMYPVQWWPAQLPGCEEGSPEGEHHIDLAVVLHLLTSSWTLHDIILSYHTCCSLSGGSCSVNQTTSGRNCTSKSLEGCKRRNRMARAVSSSCSRSSTWRCNPGDQHRFHRNSLGSPRPLNAAV